MTFLKNSPSVNKSRKFLFRETLGAATAMLMMAGIAIAPEPAQAQDIIYIPSAPPTAVLPDVNGKCDISEEMVDNWIGANPILAKLRIAFTDAYENWDAALGTEWFYYSNQDPKSLTLKAEAKADLLDRAFKLKDLARRYSTKRMKSCEQCYLYDAWGTLLEIQENHRFFAPIPPQTANAKYLMLKKVRDQGPKKPGSDGYLITGSVDMKELSQRQVSDVMDNKYLPHYLAIYSQRPPANVPDAAWDACKANLDQRRGTRYCSQDMHDQYVLQIGGFIVDALEQARAKDPKSPPMKDVLKDNTQPWDSCRSGDEFARSWKVNGYK